MELDTGRYISIPGEGASGFAGTALCPFRKAASGGLPGHGSSRRVSRRLPPSPPGEDEAECRRRGRTPSPVPSLRGDIPTVHCTGEIPEKNRARLPTGYRHALPPPPPRGGGGARSAGGEGVAGEECMRSPPSIAISATVHSTGKDRIRAIAPPGRVVPGSIRVRHQSHRKWRERDRNGVSTGPDTR
jgi:hypothetical protein